MISAIPLTEEGETKPIRRCAHGGGPIGTQEFVCQIEQTLWGILTPRNGGRPTKTPSLRRELRLPPLVVPFSQEFAVRGWAVHFFRRALSGLPEWKSESEPVGGAPACTDCHKFGGILRCNPKVVNRIDIQLLTLLNLSGPARDYPLKCVLDFEMTWG